MCELEEGTGCMLHVCFSFLIRSLHSCSSSKFKPTDCQTPSLFSLYSQSTVTFCHCLTAGAVRVCVIGLWHQVLTVSVVVYWFELVVVINLFHVVVVSLPCSCLWRDSNRRENPLRSFKLFDWVCRGCSSVLSEFTPFSSRPSSIKHSLERKTKGMDLNYYLSMSS